MSLIQRHGDWLRDFPPAQPGTTVYRRISDDCNGVVATVAITIIGRIAPTSQEEAKMLRALAETLEQEQN